MKRIEFHHFINRMSFWMTMGSGKTIVIIKLVELLDKAMESGLIPKKNVIGRLTFRISPLSDFGFIKTGLVNEN